MKRLLTPMLVLCLAAAACNSDYLAKPRGYYRIDLPQHAYQRFEGAGFPFTFEYPVYGTVQRDTSFFGEKTENPYWLNIDFPEYRGRIHLSYKLIGPNRFDSLVEDAYQLSYKQHTYRASAIDHKPFTTPNGIEGVYVTLRGNTATGNQFFMTDTVRHFLRGALYFEATPNEDSLKPVAEFFRKDLEHLINTLQWR